MSTATAIDIENVRINGERLWASLMELAKIGATPKGGVCRLTLTDLDKQGRDLVIGWARAAGMTVTIYIPDDSAALALGAEKVARAVAAEIPAHGRQVRRQLWCAGGH